MRARGSSFARRRILFGGRLIDCFASRAARAGVPGLHVVTGKAARNVGFYQRQGFVVIAEAAVPPVVMMGRSLRP